MLAPDRSLSVQLSSPLHVLSDNSTPELAFLILLKNLGESEKRNFSSFPIPSKTPQITAPLKQSIQTLLFWRELHEGKGMLPTAEEFVIQTIPLLLLLFNVSDIRVFMNLRQPSEAAAKRSWNELPRLANPLFFALFIFLKPSAMFDMADHEAQLNGLQNPMILTAGIICFDLYLASPCGRGCAPFRTLSQDGGHLFTTALPLTSSWELHHFPLRFTHPIHWLHPAHFNLIFLPHVAHQSVDESPRLLPCLMLVLKLRTFPKDQNKQREKITKQQESSLNTNP